MRAFVLTACVSVGAVISLWAAGYFTYAGLNCLTTIESVKNRYPNSSIVGSHVYVADRDSRDHIFGIDLPQSDGSCRRMRLFFERRGRTPSYPACDGIAANVTKRYGERTSVQEFTEERSWNRRLIWKHEGEQLELTCFRMGQEPLYAGDLAITSCN